MQFDLMPDAFGEQMKMLQARATADLLELLCCSLSRVPLILVRMQLQRKASVCMHIALDQHLSLVHLHLTSEFAGRERQQV
jgi:hypothetical protein